MKQRLFLLPITAGTLAFVSGCQTCCNDPNKQSAAPAAMVTPVIAAAPAAPRKPLLPTLRINAGASSIKDSSDVIWQGDSGFSGGDVIERPDIQIANTKQPEIYRSEHYAMDGFSQKLPNGKYQVKLHFCETYEGIAGPGERVFSFDVEGKQFKDFDVWAKSGGGARAHVETVPVDIADGELTIKFTPQIENPQINGIEIIPAL